MRIAIIYSEPIAGRLDSEDILDEVALIEESLDELKYEHESFPANPNETLQGDFGGLINRLRRFRPDVVFNMVEEGDAIPCVNGDAIPCVNGDAIPCVSGRAAPGVKGGNGHEFMSAIPGVLKDAGFAFTGCLGNAMRLTTDKCLTKKLFEERGILTPPWALSARPPVRVNGGAVYPDDLDMPQLPVIIKPAWEDASVGIDGGSVIYDPERIPEKLIEMHGRFGGQPMLIESFIDGREINMAALERVDGSVLVFPVVEMVFHEWPADKPRIVDYTAKWDMDSFEYHNTKRRYNPDDVPTRELKETVLKCWSAFELRGYARVDIRLTGDARIYVIEVNANPCIAEGSGFLSAAEEAGFSAAAVIDEIIRVAQKR
jgi:D-alanine-D-alanine ligase